MGSHHLKGKVGQARPQSQDLTEFKLNVQNYIGIIGVSSSNCKNEFKDEVSRD